MSTKKPAPRLARPAHRYYKGKAPKDAGDALSSDEEEPERDLQVEADEEAIGSFGDDDAENFIAPKSAIEKNLKPLRVALGNVEVKDGRVIVDGQLESGRTLVEQEMAKDAVSSDSEDEEDESSEEESDSEEELPAKPQLRPVFVPKRGRETLKERDLQAFESEEATRKREAAAEERKKQSHNMVGEFIKRTLDEKKLPEPGKEVDDTDGLDPEAEFEAWRLRELMRLRREKEAEIKREEERLEVERRRAMPEAQRLKEDLEHANKLREEKPKGQGVFLQKYWHKGAFHQDSEILKRHDYSQAVASQVDVSLLPAVMQVKDFGKRSRTKYTHLKDQDTTVTKPPVGFENITKNGEPSGCFLCGGPHLKRDCPENTGFANSRGTGHNAVPVSSDRREQRESRRYRSSRSRSRSKSPRRSNGGRRPGIGSEHYRRRSNSPRRHDAWNEPKSSSPLRRRQYSPDGSRSRSPKRRRIDP